MTSEDEQIAAVDQTLADRPLDEELDEVERVLGYTFRNRDLLRRAFW